MAKQDGEREADGAAFARAGRGSGREGGAGENERHSAFVPPLPGQCVSCGWGPDGLIAPCGDCWAKGVRTQHQQDVSARSSAARAGVVVVARGGVWSVTEEDGSSFHFDPARVCSIVQTHKEQIESLQFTIARLERIVGVPAGPIPSPACVCHQRNPLDCPVVGHAAAATRSGEEWAALQHAAEDYTRGYDGPGTAPDAEARLRAAAIVYADSAPARSPGSHHLRKAALDFDACQERLLEILAATEDGQPRNDGEHRKALQDLAVSLGDCSAAYQKASREVA